MSIEFNETHLREIAENTARSKSNAHRLDDVENDIEALKNENRTLYEMSAAIKTLTDGVVTIKDDVKEIRTEQGEMKNEIRDIKESPYKAKASFFDSAWKTVVTAIGTGIVGFILAQFFPTIFH